MKRSLSKVTDADEARKQINYFTNNTERMDYPHYRDAGWPIGSGLVEGQCKFATASVCNAWCWSATVACSPGRVSARTSRASTACVVVVRRFKGNGMRWRRHDNGCVVRTRLALLNGDLKRYFSLPEECEIAAA